MQSSQKLGGENISQYVKRCVRAFSIIIVDIALVFFGGALGAFARFSAVHLLCKGFIFSNDMSIFCINMLSCTFAGIVLALMKGRKALKWRFTRVFIQVGFLGGFSTLAALDLVLVDSTQNGGPSIFVAFFWLFLNVGCGLMLCLKVYRKVLFALDDLRSISNSEHDREKPNQVKPNHKKQGLENQVHMTQSFEEDGQATLKSVQESEVK